MLAALAAYHNSFSVPFVFDDQPAIVDNPTIRQLWPPWPALSPPRGQGLTVEGRPVLNFSLALNYAIGGTGVWSYHALNLTIHALAALTLFGLVRRTLLRRGCGFQPQIHRLEADATFIAFAVALLWVAHPLQTESVTYVVQRTESLMSLFYLLTLYAFVRAAESDAFGSAVLQPATRDCQTRAEAPRYSSNRWHVLSAFSCALGMATKEVMVSAPLLVFLYDRTFVTDSFREAWRRHGRFHLCLAATWLILGVLVLGAGNRGGTIGTSAGVTWWQYGLCQARAIIHYLRLSLWPSPLIFDYGSDFVTFAESAPFILIDAGLVALTLFALWRRPFDAAQGRPFDAAQSRPALGFLGAWFFALLAPTSSVVGGTRQMLAEHRMYLPLAAVITLAVLGLHRLLSRRNALVVVVGLAIALVVATARRNADYRSELALYADTVAKRPNNPHARYNLGKALAEAGRLDEAIAQDREAVRLRPQLVSAQYNLANALTEAGRPTEAITHYEAALALKPDYAKAHYNLGNVLRQFDRKTEAMEHYQAAVRIDPNYVEARDNLGSTLLDLGRLAEAEEQYQQVLRINPNLVETHCNLGTICLLQRRFAEAAAHYEQALRLNPRLAPAREGLEQARRAAAESGLRP